MNPMKLKILTEDEIWAIDDTSIRILSEVGISVNHSESMDILEKNGCEVDRKSKVVRIPETLIRDAVEQAPSRFEMRSYDGKHDMTMASDGSVVNFGNLGIGTRLCQYDGHGNYETRDATIADIADIAKVIEGCENFDYATQPVSALDLMDGSKARTLHEVEAMVCNTAKPYLLDPVPDYMDDYFLMMKACYGGDDEFARKNSCFMMGSCTSSPLQLDTPFCEIAKKSAEYGFPFMSMTMAMAGTTSPIDLAGTLAVHNAEALAGITLTQLYNPGNRCLYGSCTTNFDFKSNTAPFGSPENALISACNAQLAQFYGVPSVNSGGISDSKCPDFQSAEEATLNSLVPALAGASNIFGAGMIELGMTFSLEQAVMMDDLIPLIRKTMDGVVVNKETLSFDRIMEAGIGGDFIATPESMSKMFDVSHPRIFDRTMYDEWKGNGGQCTIDIAHSRVLDILQNTPSPMDRDTTEEISKIVKEADIKIKQ